jgi:hypothetical protein
MLPIPPAPAFLEEFLIEVHPIGQEHDPNLTLALVVAVNLTGTSFQKRDGWRTGLAAGPAV